MTAQSLDSKTVTEVLPEKRQLPLQGLYLRQKLSKLSEEMQRTLVVTTFLTDKNGVIAKADADHEFHVPRETQNASDWRLSQELMAQADVLIVGGSYLQRASAPGSHPQDILHQFERDGEFEELGDWRLQHGYGKRSPDVAVVTRHLDFQIPQELAGSGRRITIFTTDGTAKSDQARRFAATGATVLAGGKSGVKGDRMIDYIADEMDARVIVMVTGPRIFELLLQAQRLDLVYLTQVQREIPFGDPSTVITLLPNGRRVQDLREFKLTHQYQQDHAVAGDGSTISQLFLRCDRTYSLSGSLNQSPRSLRNCALAAKDAKCLISRIHACVVAQPDKVRPRCSVRCITLHRTHLLPHRSGGG